MPQLIKRLNNKKNRVLHTDGFNIPRTTLKKLNLVKRKGANSWLEDEVENIEPLTTKAIPDPKRNDKKSSTVVAARKPDLNATIAKNKRNAAASTETTLESESTIIISGEKTNSFTVNAIGKDSRTNFLKIQFPKRNSVPATGTNSNAHDQLLTKKQKMTENSLYESEPELTSLDKDVTEFENVEVDSSHSPWKTKSSYTDLLYTYFTIIGSTHQPKELSDLDNAPSKQTKTAKISLTYKCKICEEIGIKATSRVTGVVTCLYGNNSNMKRHIETASFV